MSLDAPQAAENPILSLRRGTAASHHRLEARLDAIEALADGSRRPALLRRYATLHAGADALFSRWLGGIPGLDLHKRLHMEPVAATPAHRWPEPRTTAEALGMFYVIEGASLGGRVITRELERRGVDTAGLGLLDPYGSEAGTMWHGFLAVLDREVRGDRATAEAVDGARRAFAHAEAVLCGDF